MSNQKKPEDEQGEASAGRPWETLSQTTVYDGFYRIDRWQFRHALHQGGWTPMVEREMFMRGNVVAVLPYDPVLDKVLLIEQFRIGAMHQQPDPWLMEVVAGMIDTEETPEQVAIREAHEEAGLALEDLTLISQYLASPGSTAEEVFIYYAESDLSQAGGVFGLDQEDEDIQVHVVDATDAINMLSTRRIRNAIRHRSWSIPNRQNVCQCILCASERTC